MRKCGEGEGMVDVLAGRSPTTGGIRQAVSAIANVGVLGVSPTIGPRALAQFLPELAATCTAMPSLIEQSLLLARQQLSRRIEPIDAVDEQTGALQSEGANAVREVTSVLADIDLHGINARTRLRLSAACGAASERLSRVCDDIEVLDWSIAQPARVSVQDLFEGLPRSTHHSILLLVAPLTLIVSVPVRLCIELLHQALVQAHATTGASCLHVTAEGHTVFVRAADFSVARERAPVGARAISISVSGARKIRPSLQVLVSSAIAIHLRPHAAGVDCHFLGLDAAADP